MAKSSAGHGIHSPFVYSFVKDVIHEHRGFKVPEKVEVAHREYLQSQKNVKAGRWGAGSFYSSNESKLGQLVKASSVSRKVGGLLYRVCQWANPQNVLEIGTSVGVSTMYLAAAQSDAKVITLEGNSEKVAIAKECFKKLSLNNVEVLEGEFDTTLSQVISAIPRADLIFFDGNHRAEPTLRYFKNCLRLKHDESVFIFDDIRWSREMYNTWKVICSHQTVSVSIDLFSLGIVFFRTGIAKQHFAVNF